jgi:hypothetical protein
MVPEVGDQEVDMAACHLPGENGQFPLHRNLAQSFADPEASGPTRTGFRYFETQTRWTWRSCLLCAPLR